MVDLILILLIVGYFIFVVYKSYFKKNKQCSKDCSSCHSNCSMNLHLLLQEVKEQEFSQKK